MPKVSKEDRELFREAVRKLRFMPSSPPATKKSSSIELYDRPNEMISPADTLFYSRGGLQHKTLKDLRTGKLTAATEIDLHGMTVEEARENLTRFIQRALQHHYRVVRIIHGKGKILKNHVAEWLTQIPSVLAYASAIPKMGGTGALCVILKSSRK